MDAVLGGLFASGLCKTRRRYRSGGAGFQADLASDQLLDPDVRYPIITASARLFKRSADKKPHEWLPLVSKLLNKAPDPYAALKEIVQCLRPWSWSGALATKLEGRLTLLEQLPNGSDAAAGGAKAGLR